MKVYLYIVIKTFDNAFYTKFPMRYNFQPFLLYNIIL